MSVAAGGACTCWLLPDPRGGTSALAWLRLQPEVLVRVSGLPGEPAELLEGRILGAGWDSKPGGSVRFILLDWTAGDALVIPEDRIEYVDIVDASEPTVLARSLGLGPAFSALLDHPLEEGNRFATALFQHPGRGCVEVTMKRWVHRCLPTDAVVEQGTSADSPNPVLLVQDPE